MCSSVSCCFKKKDSLYNISQVQERNGIVKENGEMREKSFSVSASEEVCKG